MQAQSLSGVINQYALVEAIPDSCKVVVDSVQYFSPGEYFLMIQMKGGSINTADSSTYGNVTSYGSAGNYEIAFIESIAGDTLVLQYKLANTYNTNRVIQAIHYTPTGTATITGAVTAPAWDGQRGGVVFIKSDSLILNHDIDVTGLGYRGGSESMPSVNCGQTFYETNQITQGGEKGESFIPFTLFRYGRGALAIGAGGGNNHNTGGGGGGNYGSGGRGGDEYGYGTAACNPILETGGVGGKPVAYASTLNRVFMGGGGGGGHQNDYPNDPRQGSHGADGGGIVIIDVSHLIAQGGDVFANGLSQDSATGRDGGGGAGAGGSILIEADTIIGSLAVEAKGGTGANVDNNYYNSICHGPGGGGGGGILWLSSTALQSGVSSANLSAGQAGLIINANSTCYNSHYGAQAGTAGGVRTDLTIPYGTEVCEESVYFIEAVNDTATTAVGTPVTIYVQDNDTAQTSATTTILSGPYNGTANVINGYEITYTPDSGYFGMDSLVYVICLNSNPSFCDTAVVYINIIAVEAVNDYDTIFVNTSTTINIFDNDLIVDTSYSTVLNPFSYGSYTYSNGVLSYMPNLNYTGTDTLMYVNCATGILQNCDTGYVIIYIFNVEANDDVDTTDFNTGILIKVLDNDIMTWLTDIEIICSPENGTAQVSSAPPGIYYTPNDGYSGSDLFCYRLCINDSCDTAFVGIYITPEEYISIFIPNGFSPNGDGINDYWVIRDIQYSEDNVVRIFNRWGEEIYGKEDYLNTWQGENFDGDPLPDGTYFYIVDLKDLNEKYSGYVVIQR